MKKFTLSALLLGAAFSMNAQNSNPTNSDVIFETDFSFLTDWAKAIEGDADPMGTNTSSQGNVTMPKVKIPVDGTEISAYKNFVDNYGFSLLGGALSTYWKNSGVTDAPTAKKNAYDITELKKEGNEDTTGAYLKFGQKYFTAGIQTPALGENAVGIDDFWVTIEWCPVKSGAGTYDPTHLAIYVPGSANGKDPGAGKEGRYDFEDHDIAKNTPYKWYTAKANIKGVTLKATDKIAIRPGANQWPMNDKNVYIGTTTVCDQARFYLKSIKVTKTEPKDIGTGVASIEADENAPVEYYNLQGVRVAEPSNGLYIVRQGSKVSKRIIRK